MISVNTKNPNVTPIGIYKDRLTKIEFGCKQCGNVWSATPANVLSGRGCPKCGRKNNEDSIRKENDYFINKLNTIRSDVLPLESYVTCNVPILCECLNCGNQWKISPDNLYANRKCPTCASISRAKKNTKSQEDFVKELRDVNDSIVVLDDYRGATNKIKCLCTKHNSVFYGTPTHLLGGQCGCAQCLAEKRHLGGLKSHEQFISDLQKINDEIVVRGEYIGARVPIEVECVKCGLVWTIEPTELLSGTGCRNCYQSKGERAIRLWLDKNGISYEQQKKYDDLRGVGNGKLSYDFYLPEHNMLIEYQGQFHDGTTAMSASKESLKKQQEHDNRKRDYAIKHNIILLEIWYYDKNIEEILDKHITRIP